MRGEIFIPLTAYELCTQWKSMNPPPLLLLYNSLMGIITNTLQLGIIIIIIL